LKKKLTTKETFALAIQNHQKNNLKVAENLYKKILKKNPNDFQLNFLFGSLLLQTKNFDEAKHLFQKTLQIQPNHVNAHNNLGIVFKELGELQKAKSFYQKAIQIQPNHVGAHYNLGIVFDELNEFQKAIGCYEKAIQIQPNHVGAHNNLGNALKELGEYKKAIGFYEKAIQINPNYISAHSNLATILKRQKKYKRAINICLNSINKNGKTALIYNILGTVYLELDNKKNAKKCFNESMELKKGFASEIARKYLGFLGVLPFPQQDSNKFLQNYYMSHKHKGWQDSGDSKYYHGRTIIKKAFNSYFTLKNKISILDIGCGSGGCGSFLKPHAAKLDGVDLIQEFLEIAKKKDIYSGLTNMDCIKYLTKKINAYDLIIAAAVLLHFSNLEKIFDHVYHSLHDNGHFIFSVFFNDKTSISLDSGNIFNHSHKYIKNICAKSNFVICKYSEHTHELVFGSPKKARVYIVKKK